MLINFVDATNDASHYTKPPPKSSHVLTRREAYAAMMHDQSSLWL